ncbi:MAG: cell envelope integrity protein CreD, partial [Burkholderiales bacterium]
RQSVAGPFLSVPYERTWTETTQEIVDGKSKERRIERSESRVLRLPVESVHWSIEVATSEKARGIYKARLYSARIQVRGRIVVPERFGLGETTGKIHWGTPRFVLGVSDPRGIRSVALLSIGDERLDFLPGAGDAALTAGVHAALENLRADKPRTLDYAFSLELAGAEALALVPLARDNTVVMRADWPHPSFQGVFLPARHELSPEGFAAHWQVSRYAAQGGERLAACERAKPCAALTAQEIGVSFIEPVGVYHRLERASKYGFLFIGLTFAAFMLFELFRRLAIHPVQYTLVGLALAMFFLLLTALSEHIAFGLAYAAATLACVGLVASYVAYVLRSAVTGLAFGVALGSLYGVLYMLLRAEDYALLAGSILLFALLAALMIATRRVDWYQLTRRAPEPARG